MMSRRTALAAGLLPLAAQAQDWLPHRPVRLVVPTAIRAAVGGALSDPVLAARLADLGVAVPPPDRRGPVPAAAFIAAEAAKWGQVIATAGIRAA